MLPTHAVLPPIVSGYELNPAKSYFGVILPEATINLVANPSVELDTTGYAAVSSSTLTRTTDWQTHGAWGLKVTPSAVATSGVYYGTVATVAGSLYTFSLDFQGVGGQSYTIYFADTSGAQLGASFTFTATGQRQRVKVRWTEVVTASRRLYITKASGASTQPFYLDGLQVEAKAYDTTYTDGDQQGFVSGQAAYGWLGAPHASTSFRNAETRAGGRIVSFNDYNFRVSAITGLGAATPDNVANQYGLLDGAYYQRTVIPPRQFAIIGSVNGNGLAAVQRARAGLIAAFRHDSVAPDQPLVLVYQRAECELGKGDTLYLPCVYSGGLEGDLNNLYQERLAIAFTQLGPYAQLATDRGAVLDPSDSYSTSVGFYQDLNGGWQSLSAGGPHLRRIVVSPSGTYLGFYNTAATTFTIYRFDPATGTLTNIGTSASGATLYALFVDSRGRLWAGGTFTSLGGVACSNAAYYDGSVWVNTGTPGFVVRDFAEGLTTSISAIFAGGEDAGGTAGFVKYWLSGTTWTAIGAPSINDSVYTLAMGPVTAIPGSFQQILYIGGAFTSIYGAAVSYLAQTNVWGLAFSLSAAAAGVDAEVRELAFLPNGNLVAAGGFSSIGTAVGHFIGVYNGQFWAPLDQGLGAAPAADCQSLAISPDGLLYVVSPGLDRSYQQVLSACGGVVFNGQRFTPIPFQSTIAAPQCVGVYGPGRVIFGSSPTTNLTSGIITATNNGSARGYPIIVLRFAAGATATAYFLAYVLQNLTGGGRIAFENLIVVPGEVVTLNTDPANPSLTSNYNGNLIRQLAAGSDLAGFALLPGANRISLLASVYGGSGTVEPALYWRERSYGLDAAVQ